MDANGVLGGDEFGHDSQKVSRGFSGGLRGETLKKAESAGDDFGAGAVWAGFNGVGGEGGIATVDRSAG